MLPSTRLLCHALFTGLLAFAAIPALAQQKPFEKKEGSLIVYPSTLFSGDVQMVRLQPVNEAVIRVTASPAKAFSGNESLITVYDTTAPVAWQLVRGKDSVSLKTSRLTATVSLTTGGVAFYNSKGQKIVAEKAAGRSLQPAVFEGQPSYAVQQLFQTSSDDAFYGLGQHQEDVYNHKGRQVYLFQNNTEVAVPFLVSSKNYGILWDNYSLTTAGDVRPFRELHALRLFSKRGEEGWLTATYSNDKMEPAKAVVERSITKIDMAYLGESKVQLPAEFKPENGVVTYEGKIASGFDGVHQFRFTYGGYLKVWIDGKLAIDRWRRAWNPAPALIDVAMQKGVALRIKIEWIPEGAESYLTLKWLEPQPKMFQNTFGFHSEAGQQLDYYFIHGRNLDSVISGYRTLTGKATMVPKWALGFWQSRERYKTADEVLSTVAEFRKRNIPLDNIVLDWSYWKEDQWGSQEFDETRFPAPDSMIKVLHANYHTQFMISVWPKFYEGISTYTDFDKKGWLYRRNIADRQRDWIGQGYVSTFYDAFNEGARRGFWNLIWNKIGNIGVDAWWMDASEPDILSNVSPQKRKEQMTPLAAGLAAEYVNAYPLQNARGIYEGQRQSLPGKRVFLLTRSGFAGSQRYGAAIWSGDIGARWHDMKAQIPAGINFSLSGIPYWTMDIGGFVVENRFERPDTSALEEWRELNTRWFQFGAFVPLFRVHGQYPFREIYNIAPEEHPAYQSMLFYNKLRYRLLPYIYSLAGQTYHQDYTIMRGLVMDFAGDTAVHNIGDQYLFGPSLLVNPVYAYKQRQRDVYLPKGTGWYHLYSGTYTAGGKKISAEAPYERMPIFVKEGSIIPFGPELQYAAERKTDTVNLFVYGGKNASFSFYEDEGSNYNYEKGLFATIEMGYNEATKTLTIGERKGSFPQMLQQRVFQVYYVTPGRPRELNFLSKPDKKIQYIGKSVSLTLSDNF